MWKYSDGYFRRMTDQGGNSDGCIFSDECICNRHDAQQMRMDVIAQNIANANTTRTENGGAYRRKTVVFEEQDTTSFDHMLNGYMSNYEPNGVKVTKIVEDPSDLRLVYEPDNPDANADGYVEYPNVDTVTEMTNLIDSSRSYEASATAFNAAKNIAAKGLELFNS